MTDVILKQFEAPDETQPYAPGWRWSEHVDIVVLGRATAATDTEPSAMSPTCLFI